MNHGRLARGAVWNLLGQVVPLVAALVCIPRLVHSLGAERFGVLTLAWALVGYFTLFDLGIGPAVTRALSAFRAEGREADAPGWFWTAIALTFALGLVGALIVAGLAPWLAHSALRVTPGLQAETRGILLVLAFSLPFVTVSAASGGALAAYQRFGALNAVRVPLGILTFLAPLLVTFWTTNLAAIGGALALTRGLGALANLALCARHIPGVGRPTALRREAVRPLLGYGGWLTVSAVAGPFMVYFDRFLIGSLLSVAMVAYYTTPYDLTTRVWVLSQSVVGVLFPAMSESFSGDPAAVQRLFGWGIRGTAALVFPITFVLVLFAPEGMGLWLGGDFARQSGPILRWIAAGAFLNALAQIALAAVQASGKPRWSATLHVVELPLYLAALVWLVQARGIEGAAQAWFLRVVFDTAALFVLAARRLEGGRRPSLFAGALCCGALGTFAIAVALPTLQARGVFGIVVAALFAWAVHRSRIVQRLALGSWVARGRAAGGA